MARSGKSRDTVFEQELLLLEPRYLGSFTWGEGPAPLEIFQQRVEAAVFGSQLSDQGFLRDPSSGAQASSDLMTMYLDDTAGSGARQSPSAHVRDVGKKTECLECGNIVV
jgi:hypothetical protein